MGALTLKLQNLHTTLGTEIHIEIDDRKYHILQLE